MRAQLICLASMGVAAMAPFAASAMVLEIADNGQVVVHDVERAPARPSRPAKVAGPLPFGDVFAASSDRYDLSTELIAAIGWAESRFRADAKSPAGALGVMQLMPATARQLGVNASVPAENIRGGSAYVRSLLDRYQGDIVKTLAAYNAGPGAVDRYRGVPPYRETRAYVARVLDDLAAVSLSTETPR